VSVATLARGRYRVERVLGAGGMAVVYRAHDEELHRPVAIKLPAEHLAEDAEFERRFLREAQVASRLSHPNVVAVYDAGDEEGRPYIVMEVVEGETLADRLARRGPLPAAEVAALGAQAAAGLGHAHAHGLVHRDVKPHNLLLRDDGTVKVADFGIARAAEATQRLTQAGANLGTAAYLAPEQAHGEDVSPATDVYGLGAVLYEALTGRPPFAAATIPEALLAQRDGAVTPPGDLVDGVPPRLEQTLMRCLARNPRYRPQDGRELERLLRADDDATVPLPSSPARRRRRTPRALAALAAILLALAAAAVVAVVLTSGDDAPPPAFPRDRPDRPAQQARDLAQWLRDVSG
jgi:serine/threonine-protein kinase